MERKRREWDIYRCKREQEWCRQIVISKGGKEGEVESEWRGETESRWF